jgi:hypothetical protein
VGKERLKVGGAIVTAAISAVSSALNAFNFLPNISWARVSLISIILFIVFVFWGWYSTEKRIRQLEEQRPSITAYPTVLRNRAALVVRNHGNGGDFSATVKIGDKPELETCHLIWEMNNSPRCPIDGGGGEARLLITGLFPIQEQAPHVSPEKKEKYASFLALTRFITGHLNLITLYEIERNKTADYKCELAINIFSQPSLLKPFTKNYVIRLHDRELSFTALDSGKGESRA